MGGELLGCAGAMDWALPARDVEIVAGRRECACRCAGRGNGRDGVLDMEYMNV